MTALANVVACDGAVLSGPVPPPGSGPTAAIVEALSVEFPDEDFGWISDKVSPLYIALRDAGWPRIRPRPGGGFRAELLLQRHLDGSGWVMGWHGAMTCLPAGEIGELSGGDPLVQRAWQPINIHNLTDSQIRVLCTLGRAIPCGFSGRDVRPESWGVGLIDDEIAAATGLAVSTVQHLRAELVHKCLVIAKQGLYDKRASNGGALAQVWVLTRAGYDALDPPAPSTAVLSAQLDRQAVAAPG